jgi:hypothetical protein
MVTGIVSGPWGHSPENIAGMANNLSNRFTNQLGLSSYPGSFRGDQYVSPLTTANANWYTAFGKRRSKFGSCKSDCKIYTREQCTTFLNSNKTINPITGKKITPRSSVYKALSAQCQNYQTQPIYIPSQPTKRSGDCNQTLYNKYSVVYNCSDRNANKKLVLNGKTFERGSPAFYDDYKTQGGVVMGMGCKQVTVLTRDKIQKHVPLENFFKYNF